jgi:hypothetical protein
MKFEEILKFINIDSNFYNLLTEYKKNPKLYEKEVISTIIEKTKYTPEAIKLLTSNYSNSSFLKEYIGKNDKEIFQRMMLSAIDDKNKDDYFFNIYADILKSPSVSSGIKFSIVSSITDLSIGYKMGQRINNIQKEYGQKGKDNIINNIIHTKIKFEDLNWLSEIFPQLKLNHKLSVFNRIFNSIWNEEIKNLNFVNLKQLRDMYMKIIPYFKTYEEPKKLAKDEEFLTSSNSDDYYEKEKRKKIDNIINLFEIKDEKFLGESKKSVIKLFEIGKWFVQNMEDNNSDINKPGRVFDSETLIESFTNIFPEFEFITLKDIEENLGLNLDIFENYIKNYTNDLRIPFLKNKKINISNKYKYFKNTEYEEKTFNLLFEKANIQFEEMKEIEKLIKDRNSRDNKEIKEIVTRGINSYSSHSSKTDNQEENEKIANQILQIPGFSYRKDYNSFSFWLEYNELFSVVPEKMDNLIKKLFTSDINLTNCRFSDNTGNTFKNPLINSIVTATFLVKTSEHSLTDSLKKDRTLFNLIMKIYLDNMNEKQKPNVIDYLFQNIILLENIGKEHKIILDDFKKYHGIGRMLAPLLHNINSYYKYELKKEKDIFGNIPKNTNGETNLKIFNEYFKKNNEIENFNYEEGVYNPYFKYLKYHNVPNEEYKKIIDKFIISLKDKNLDKTEQNEKINSIIKNLIMECFNNENVNDIGEYIYTIYFDEIKEENDIINMIKYSYEHNIKSLQNKIKLIDLGTTPKGLKISSLIKTEEEKLISKGKDRNILPSGVITIDNEKRKKAIEIIDESLETLFKLKSEEPKIKKKKDIKNKIDIVNKNIEEVGMNL